MTAWGVYATTCAETDATDTAAGELELSTGATKGGMTGTIDVVAATYDETAAGAT